MTIRIAKFLADNGIASRRGAEEMIKNGRVSVNGITLTTPAFFVNDSDKIFVDKKQLRTQNSELRTLYLFHKPINTMTTNSDPNGRKTIYDVLPKKYRNLKYVGRLDFKTTGLLLMTNDGDLARELTLPKTGLIRTYIATLHPEKQTSLMRKFLSPIFSEETIFDSLRSGLKINGINYAPMNIEVLSRYPITVKISITEGKKNEIRIAMNYIGFMVKKLHRISYGPYNLGELKPGAIKVVDVV